MTAVCLITPGVYGYGSLLIGGILEQAGASVSINKDLVISSSGSSPKIIGLSAHSVSDLINCKDFIGNLKRLTKSLVVVGGPAAVLPEIVFGILPDADLVAIGEGEETVAEILKHEKYNTPLEDIKGISFVRNRQLVCTERRGPSNLIGRPLPKIPADLKHQSIRSGGGIIGANVYIETHRGCSSSCTFCSVPIMFGKKIRSRPLPEIVAEAKAFKNAGVSRVAISGGSVSAYGCDCSSNNEAILRDLLRNMCKIFGKANIAAADIRADQADEGVLSALKNYTVGWIALGLESGSERVLRKMCKGIDLSDARETVSEARKLGVNMLGSFIVGYPEEEEEDFQASRDLVHELQLDDYAVSIAEPFPGTPLFNQMVIQATEESPVSQPAGIRLNGDETLTLAAYRATVLQQDAYEVIKKRRCPRTIRKRFLARAKLESERIAKTIRICRRIMRRRKQDLAI